MAVTTESLEEASNRVFWSSLLLSSPSWLRPLPRSSSALKATSPIPHVRPHTPPRGVLRRPLSEALCARPTCLPATPAESPAPPQHTPRYAPRHVRHRSCARVDVQATHVAVLCRVAKGPPAGRPSRRRRGAALVRTDALRPRGALSLSLSVDLTVAEGRGGGNRGEAVHAVSVSLPLSLSLCLYLSLCVCVCVCTWYIRCKLSFAFGGSRRGVRSFVRSFARSLALARS